MKGEIYVIFNSVNNKPLCWDNDSRIFEAFQET